MKTIGIVVVGAGRIGRMHAEIFSRTPGARVLGIVDRRLRRDWREALGLGGVGVFASTTEALKATGAEAAVIAASSSAHAELVREAAAAGAHVLCEKPVAFRAETIAALAAEVGGLEGAGGKVVQVGFNRRFDPHFARVRTAVESGGLGRAYLYRVVNRDPRRPPADFIPRSGGMLADLNIHDFDMLRFLSGAEIAEVYARGGRLIAGGAMGGDWDAMVLSVRMSDGALAAVDSLRETNCGYDQRLEVAGEGGMVRAENIPSDFSVRSGPDGSLHSNPRRDFIERYRESFEIQAREFLRTIRGERACAAGLADATAAMRAAEAAQKSLEENRPVAVG